ncbi:MAG: PDZ domain-containing protein [Clostridia bacterium]|nr:PDZ domain-containing protein [Clostridia bacterium]
MKLGNYEINKRTGVIIVIAVLIGLNVALTVTCIGLFTRDIQRNRLVPINNVNSGETADPNNELTDAEYVAIGNVIREIEQIFNSKYVRERGSDYKSRVINGYLSGIGDPYAHYYTPEEMQKNIDEDNGSSYGIGVFVAWTGDSLKIIHVMQDSPASRAGIIPGDDLKGVNGAVFSDMSYSEAVASCRGEKGDEKNFTVERDGSNIEIKIVCGDYTVESVFTSIKEKNGVKIGVIECTQFIYPTPGEIKAAVEKVEAEGVKGIVFDMRGNPGGLLDSVVKVLDYLLPEGPVVHLTYKNSALNETYSSDAEYATDLPFVILVSGSTASAGELFTSCMRDFNRATIVGTTTFGKGCGQTQYKLSDGGYIKLTSFFYDPPTSENYDGEGIVPDVVVELPEEYANVNLSLIPEGEDDQMEAALDILAK